MDETLQELAQFLGLSIARINSLIFPDSRLMIRLNDVAESSLAGVMLRYIPNAELAAKSGVPELYNHPSAEEAYEICIERMSHVGQMFDAYSICYGRFFPQLEPPGVGEILTGMAAHEVRHRVQLHFNPLLAEPGVKDNEVYKIARALFEDQKFSESTSRRMKELEFDARVAEVMVVHDIIVRESRESFEFDHRLILGDL